MGKQTLNMKPSIFKQLLKSCKDGVSMTIQAPVGFVPNGNVSPGKRLRYSSDSNYSQGYVTNDVQYVAKKSLRSLGVTSGILCIARMWLL